jgi:imidazolonepropionase-like amidohydrolase
MVPIILTTPSYFDGARLHDDGPYCLEIANGVISRIARGAPPEPPQGAVRYDAGFVMPGLVEAHCHLFLDGGELDFSARAAALKAGPEAMARVARRNVAALRRAGVSLIRDAGDRFGINHRMRAEARQAGGPIIRSPGAGLRRPKRYGGFMAREVADDTQIDALVAEIAQDGDDLKIILTGIIDFAAGEVRGAPQFDAPALTRIMAAARRHGLASFAHCSGQKGLALAVAAGVGSIEHGFFMSRDILEVMATRQIGWTPTVSPVHVQWAHPEAAGWDAATLDNLRRILDRHREHMALAHELGVPLIAGSDAGSHGVIHGRALIDELFFMIEAGLPMAAVLAAATATPRRLWGAAPADIVAGGRADMLALAGSPFEDAGFLRQPRAIIGETVSPVAGLPAPLL